VIKKILPRGNVVFIFILSLYLLSCGLEDLPYLTYIPDGIMNDVTSASIRLPSYPSYFTHFEIYYRIYISGVSLPGLINTPDLRSQINGSLNSDFQGLYPLTDKTNSSANPSNLETVFSNRRYFKLTLEEANIDTVLGSGPGRTLDISFSGPNGVRPVLSLNSVPYTLQRANSGPSLVFNPVPNRYFLNHQDLYNTANVTNEKNADVATPNPNTPISPRYTYVSMYIFATGRDYLSTFYSQPTHIGIFRLPEAN